MRSLLMAVRDWLLPGQAEPAGFGAYSYLLFAAPPRDVERERHLRVLMAYVRQLPERAEVESYLQKSQLNLFQLPLRQIPKLPANPGSAGDAALRASAERLLADYDHVRAQVLLAGLGLPAGSRGPLLVTRVPAVLATSGGDQLLIEDMSRVEPVVAEQWMALSADLVNRQRHWDRRVLTQLALEVRNLIAQVASAVPDIDTESRKWVRVSELRPR
jgi:hypothetical protein